MLSEVATSWRTMRIMWGLGLIDVKWLAIGFLSAVVVSWIVWEIVLRHLERENRRLRLMLDAQRANGELARLGSPVRIDLED